MAGSRSPEPFVGLPGIETTRENNCGNENSEMDETLERLEEARENPSSCPSDDCLSRSCDPASSGISFSVVPPSLVPDAGVVVD